jgi:hypothetical protein
MKRLVALHPHLPMRHDDEFLRVRRPRADYIPLEADNAFYRLSFGVDGGSMVGFFFLPFSIGRFDNAAG